MLKIRDGRLSPAAMNALAEYQRDVDAQNTYRERVSRAKTRFTRYNRKTNPTFAAVRAKLAEMCGRTSRCMYCEDSFADEVEHFRPKDLFPEVVFAWRNYLYACGPCNGSKSNRFSVVAPGTGELVDVTRRRRARVTPPREGAAVLIDPRHENPLDFIILDLRDTFEFTPLADSGTVEFRRADYTIDLLRLNDRNFLTEARRNARGFYEALLDRYVTLTRDGASHRQVARVKGCIQGSPHPTVWAEMKRQHRHHDRLATLFHAAPEALDF